MKLSILTATYNRGNYLLNLYNSIIKNLYNEVQIEWLIMNDGSNDNTKEVIDGIIKEDKIEIKYYEQENQGKMIAINNLMEYVSGDLLVECDSDDWFADNAFESIYNVYQANIGRRDLYAFCFLKFDSNGKNMGKVFQKDETTMFDLYFKQGEDGEKALVFFTKIRKQFKYEIENNEKFITEARMYHKMDQQYKMLCINTPLMICEYQDKGYTKNITKQFKENPYGYFKYFKEIFEHDFKGVPFKKRLYVIKHYILFAVLTNQKNVVRQATGFFNKFLVTVLYVPGKFKTRKKFGD